MTFWVTSDLHLNHRTLVKARNFTSNESHDKLILKELNSCVKENSILYHLGDFSPRNSAKYIADLISRINCKKINFIKGNHDQKLEEAIKIYNEKFSDKRLTLKENDKISISDSENKSYNFYLQHYAPAVWVGSGPRHKTMALFGHSHAALDKELSRILLDKGAMDIGIDAYFKLYGKYRPFSLKEILNILNKK